MKKLSNLLYTNLNEVLVMKNAKIVFMSLCMVAFHANAQDNKSPEAASKPGKEVAVKSAFCTVSPTQGNKVSGTVVFTKVNGGIKIVADIQGLSKGKHGFHIHEFGDCSAPDATSAGNHFNPMAKNHGSPMDAMRHDGDMGNIEANDSGKGHLEYVDKSISLEGSNSIVGKSVVVHQDEDDLTSQPSGNAGARVACGVIEAGKP